MTEPKPPFAEGHGFVCSGSGETKCRLELDGLRPLDRSYSVLREDRGAVKPEDGAFGIRVVDDTFFGIRGGDLFTACVSTISASTRRGVDLDDSDDLLAAFGMPSCCRGCSQRMSSSCSETSGTLGYRCPLVTLLLDDRQEGLWRGLMGAAFMLNSSGIDSKDLRDEFAERVVCRDFSALTEE
jgi:hypothetical protein